jgi:hypothetical protein
MLPYSAVAAIDYAAYQSRPGLSASNGAPLGASFTHSWLVPTQDLCGVNFKPNQQQNQLIVDPGHVERLFYFFMIFRVCDVNVGKNCLPSYVEISMPFRPQKSGF